MRIRNKMLAAPLLAAAMTGMAAARDSSIENDAGSVGPATGAGRAFYVPLDEARILPRLRGMYLTPRGKLAEGEVKHIAGTGGAGSVDEGAPNWITGYDATIDALDMVSSSGAKLEDIAAILQQDRFNVDVRGIRQGRDRPDEIFSNKKERLELGRAIVDISPALRKQVLSGTASVHVEVTQSHQSGRYHMRLTPAGRGEADSSFMSWKTSRPIFEMPKIFHGKWANSQDECRSGASLVVTTVDATGLHQAEGEMAVKSVLPDLEDPNHMILNTHNFGGGGDWGARYYVTLSKDGGTLEFRELGNDPGAPFTLFRCK